MRNIEHDNLPEWRCSRDEIALSEYHISRLSSLEDEP
jgi:hypothetical protein